MPVQCRVLPQHLLVQPPQRRRRVDAQLSGQSLAQLTVGAERACLPAAAVQRDDPQAGQSLAQRMLRPEAVQLGTQARVPAAGQVRLHPPLERGQPGFLQPPGISLREGKVSHVRQGLTAPQAQRGAEHLGRFRRSSSSEVGIRRAHHALEPGRVQLVVGHHQPVAGRVRHQGARLLAERAAQPGDVYPQRGHAVRGRTAGPQVLGEPVSRHHPVGGQQQPRQQRALAQPAKLHGLPPVGGFDGAENAELHCRDASLQWVQPDATAIIAAATPFVMFL